MPRNRYHFEKITRDHVIKAIDRAKKHGNEDKCDSKHYDLIYEGKKYPPKNIFKWAYFYATNIMLDNNKQLSGGKRLNQYLINLGFTIVKRP